jgi:photosystem II stability/assembly factor-like uncharacterized protein
MSKVSSGMVTPHGWLNLISSLMPLAIIAGLLYAAFFIKPSVTSKAVPPPLLESRDHLYGLAIAQDQHVWVAGSDGKILHTDKAGSGWIWTAQKAGVETDFQAIAAWDKQRAVAVGNQGVALFTADGGANWMGAQAPKSSVANKLVRVEAQPGGLGYAVGEYNAILKSADYGRTWTRLTAEKDVVWYGLATAGKKILVAGEFGRTLISADEGASWQEIQTPVKVHLTGAVFKNEQESVLVGLNGTILRSTDGGKNWQIISAGIDEHIYDVIWDGARYVACGDRGLLITSADGTDWHALDAGLDATQRNYLWFMQIRQFGAAYLLAGSTLALVENKRFRDFSKPVSAQPAASTFTQ